MNKKIIGIFVCMLLIITTHQAVANIIGIKEKVMFPSQLCVVEWSKTYGGSEFDMFHCVHQTQDEGFITSGATEVSNKYYPLVMKLDSSGEVDWQWTINQITYEQVSYDIQDIYPIFCNQVSDNGYILCLWLDINYNEALYTIAGLFKFNENGEQEWTEFYSEGFNWGLRPISFIEIEDGYIVTGTSGDSTSYMGDDAFLLKIDKNGNQQWSKEYKYGDFDDRTEAVCRTSDNGYILTGWAKDNSYNYWIIKTDEFGNEQWNKIYGGDKDDYGHTKSCYQTSDGGFVTGGFSSSFGAGKFDAWIIKTDSNGNMVWDKTYGETKDDVCWDLKSISDGGFVAVVTKNYNGFSGDKDDINIVKLDSEGNIEWVQEYGGSGIQLGGSIDTTSDGGFIVSGCTGTFHSSRSDALLVKFSSMENKRPNKPAKPSGPAKGEPDIEYTFSTSATDPDNDQIYYKWDWGDGNFSNWLDTNEASYTWTTEDNFEIRVIAKDSNGGESDWSDPLSFSTPKNKVINKYSQNILQNSHNLVSLIQLLLHRLGF